ncbi:MAG: hypothetical protein MZV63_05555 [Marinilabiliales bacterium]|nr:hypothetical protein [Marinilabiliales bacterium]
MNVSVNTGRALLGSLAENRSYIFSHELAALLHITAVQVRRDLMLIGYGSVMRKGYDIQGADQDHRRHH